MFDRAAPNNDFSLTPRKRPSQVWKTISATGFLYLFMFIPTVAIIAVFSRGNGEIRFAILFGGMFLGAIVAILWIGIFINTRLRRRRFAKLADLFEPGTAEISDLAVSGKFHGRSVEFSLEQALKRPEGLRLSMTTKADVPFQARPRRINKEGVRNILQWAGLLGFTLYLDVLGKIKHGQTPWSLAGVWTLFAGVEVFQRVTHYRNFDNAEFFKDNERTCLICGL